MGSVGGIWQCPEFAVNLKSIFYVLLENLSSDMEFSVMLQKIWLFYKTSEKHHKWGIYMP
jgi:hypothetical protein